MCFPYFPYDSTAILGYTPLPKPPAWSKHPRPARLRSGSAEKAICTKNTAPSSCWSLSSIIDAILCGTLMLDVHISCIIYRRDAYFWWITDNYSMFMYVFPFWDCWSDVCFPTSLLFSCSMLLCFSAFQCFSASLFFCVSLFGFSLLLCLCYTLFLIPLGSTTIVCWPARSKPFWPRNPKTSKTTEDPPKVHLGLIFVGNSWPKMQDQAGRIAMRWVH